jgi:hypothetical protein
MVRRKGELSSADIDQGWPYQVALEARLTMGDRYYTVHYFCDDLSLCRLGQWFSRDGVHFNVFCFAERAHADKFKAKFGGEYHDANKEPRWWRARSA